jgi:hypothetical protein
LGMGWYGWLIVALMVELLLISDRQFHHSASANYYL